ncbi:MAG: C-terminal binding protein [Pirellulaceae bacterium]
MPAYKVLLTDYAWPDVELERQVLAEIDAELIVAPKDSSTTVLGALAAEVDAILTCWAQLPEEVLGRARRCQIVSRMGIGLDNIDVDFCSRHGIPVTNVPDYCVEEVAEHALALMMALARNVAFFHQDTKCGRYDLNAAPIPRRLSGQTLGIVGLGSIGCRLASKAAALGLHVMGVSRHRMELECVRPVALDELLTCADFVSLHVPSGPETHHMIGADELKQMKSSAFLINTARGGLIDHQALANALAQSQLAGAALDVQDPEPPDLSLPPYSDPRVIVTPHSAFASVESLEELRRRAAQQVAVRLTGGTPDNVVNGSCACRGPDHR